MMAPALSAYKQFMWDHVDLPPDQRRQFLSPPDQLSLHNYGAAVDITLATADGLAIDMGTPYDDPGVLSYPIRESEFLANGSLSHCRTGCQPATCFGQ